MYAHTHVYIHMYISPRQKSHGSRNSENKTLLMSAGSAVSLGNQLHLPNTFQSHVWLFLLQTPEIAGKGKERNGNSILHFSFDKGLSHFQGACNFSAFRSLCCNHCAGSSAAGDVNIQQSIILFNFVGPHNFEIQRQLGCH